MWCTPPDAIKVGNVSVRIPPIAYRLRRSNPFLLLPALPFTAAPPRPAPTEYYVLFRSVAAKLPWRRTASLFPGAAWCWRHAASLMNPIVGFPCEPSRCVLFPPQRDLLPRPAQRPAAQRVVAWRSARRSGSGRSFYLSHLAQIAVLPFVVAEMRGIAPLVRIKGTTHKRVGRGTAYL